MQFRRILSTWRLKPTFWKASKMASHISLQGLDLPGFALKLCGLCRTLGYPYDTEYQGNRLPNTDSNNDSPRATWEATAVILTGSSSRTSLSVTAGVDSFSMAWQSAALMVIGARWIDLKCIGFVLICGPSNSCTRVVGSVFICMVGVFSYKITCI